MGVVTRVPRMDLSEEFVEFLLSAPKGDESASEGQLKCIPVRHSLSRHEFHILCCELSIPRRISEEVLKVKCEKREAGKQGGEQQSTECV